MAARITRLVTRRESIRSDQAAELRQLVLGLESEAPAAARQLLTVIDRHTAASKGWSFVMLSPAQNRSVVRWILEHSRRQSVALALWTEFFCHLQIDTGEIMLDRKQMMEAADASSSHVSEALSELVKVGALIRRQEGREVRWFMNPTIGTCLTGKAREDAQRSAPALRLVPAASP